MKKRRPHKCLQAVRLRIIKRLEGEIERLNLVVLHRTARLEKVESSTRQAIKDAVALDRHYRVTEFPTPQPDPLVPVYEDAREKLGELMKQAEEENAAAKAAGGEGRPFEQLSPAEQEAFQRGWRESAAVAQLHEARDAVDRGRAMLQYLDPPSSPSWWSRFWSRLRERIV